MADRLSRDDLYFTVAITASLRSTCLRKRVGAAIVPKRGIIVVGYNGSPPGQPHCLDVGCLIDPQTGACIRTTHAELNGISHAARCGVPVEGAAIYITLSPCLPCAKAIVTAGITEVLYLEEYRDTSPLEYLASAGVRCHKRFGDPLAIWAALTQSEVHGLPTSQND